VSVTIRNAADRDDLALFLQIGSRVSDDTLPPVEELEHLSTVEPEAAFYLAELDGVVAGSGIGRLSSVTGCLYAIPRVVPEARRRGVGTALYATLSDHARVVGRDALVARVREDDVDSLEFARKRGFREISRELPVVLDLEDAAVDSPEPPPGVEIASLADHPELEQSAYEVDVEATPDIPTEGELRAAETFGRWRGFVLEAPSSLPDAMFVAIAAGTVVGYAQLIRVTDDVAENGLTAVRRAWRGRGIATALKRAQIEWAKAAGFKRIQTANDEANVAMRGINRRLGYKPEPASLLLRGPLS
jgi:GNAT superfamily N-acetyltransferase